MGRDCPSCGATWGVLHRKAADPFGRDVPTQLPRSIPSSQISFPTYNRTAEFPRAINDARDAERMINEAIANESPELARWLFNTWNANRRDLKFEEIFEAFQGADFVDPDGALERFRARYNRTVNERFAPQWFGAASNGGALVANGLGLGGVDSDSPYSLSYQSHLDQWVRARSADFVTEVTQSDRNALRAVFRKWTVQESIGPREAARFIRPMIGLTSRQAAGVWNLYEGWRADGIPEAVARRKAETVAARRMAKRAQTIARTELASAFNYGGFYSVKAAFETGALADTGDVVEKRWFTQLDERVCPFCGPLHGQLIAMNATFPGLTPTLPNVFVPPAHPNCRCVVLYEVTEADEDAPQRQQIIDTPKPPGDPSGAEYVNGEWLPKDGFEFGTMPDGSDGIRRKAPSLERLNGGEAAMIRGQVYDWEARKWRLRLVKDPPAPLLLLWGHDATNGLETWFDDTGLEWPRVKQPNERENATWSFDKTERRWKRTPKPGFEWLDETQVSIRPVKPPDVEGGAWLWNRNTWILRPLDGYTMRGGIPVKLGEATKTAKEIAEPASPLGGDHILSESDVWGVIDSQLRDLRAAFPWLPDKPIGTEFLDVGPDEIKRRAKDMEGLIDALSKQSPRKTRVDVQAIGGNARDRGRLEKETATATAFYDRALSSGKHDPSVLVRIQKKNVRATMGSVAESIYDEDDFSSWLGDLDRIAADGTSARNSIDPAIAHLVGREFDEMRTGPARWRFRTALFNRKGGSSFTEHERDVLWDILERHGEKPDSLPTKFSILDLRGVTSEKVFQDAWSELADQDYREAVLEAATQAFGGRETHLSIKKSFKVGGVMKASRDATKRTIWHESGHYVEAFNARQADASRRFIARRIRTDGKGYRKLSEITGSSVYDDSEIADEDKFSSAYVGKSYYQWSSSEVAAMGLQSFSDPEMLAVFASRDPEHFALEVARLRGAFGFRDRTRRQENEDEDIFK